MTQFPGDSSSLPPVGPGEKELRLHAGPILREALASVGPGEDVDEALLRVLKMRYPQQAQELLSVISRTVEFHAEQTKVTRAEAMKRLAEDDPGPEIVLRSSTFSAPRVVTETKVITVNGKHYNSLDDVPPEIRHAIQDAMSGGDKQKRVRVKTGCSMVLVIGLWFLVYGFWLLVQG